jgi:hypothetical protein
MKQKTTEMISAVDAKPGALSVHWTLIVKFWRLPNYLILPGDKTAKVCKVFLRFVIGLQGKFENTGTNSP